jgi:hypothetical protein
MRAQRHAGEIGLLIAAGAFVEADGTTTEQPSS